MKEPGTFNSFEDETGFLDQMGVEWEQKLSIPLRMKQRDAKKLDLSFTGPFNSFEDETWHREDVDGLGDLKTFNSFEDETPS